jgi:hypothetical protein
MIRWGSKASRTMAGVLREAAVVDAAGGRSICYGDDMG